MNEDVPKGLFLEHFFMHVRMRMHMWNGGDEKMSEVFNVEEIFAKNVFTLAKMQERLTEAPTRK